jgi:DMSO/TMAO reductase YedYZ molybdopterin-dependent catalytic subunit
VTDLEPHDVPSDVDADSWSLTLDGSLERPRSFSLADLRALGLVDATADFSCVEGWTARDVPWRGVPVAAVLASGDPRPEAAFALVTAMDGGYACGYSLARLREAVLAVEFDGDPLPVEHGGPARLVFPASDSECWESLKWVARIDLRASPPDAEATARDVALARLE